MARADDGRRLPVDDFRVVRAWFLVGADGANGFVRDGGGIQREDYGFNERWLDVDTRPRRPLGEGAGRIGDKDITSVPTTRADVRAYTAAVLVTRRRQGA